MIEWEIRIEPGGSVCQDRAAILEIGPAHVMVVADGAGGPSGGAEAAELVVRDLERLRPSRHEFSVPDFWCGILRGIDDAIVRDGSAGETTAVVVAAIAGRLTGASVGDSGAFLFGAETFDDLTAHQRRKPLLGSGSAIPVGFGPVPFTGTLVVASDGLLKYTGTQQIWSCATSAAVQDAATAVAELPRLPSGGYPDDVAVMLVRPR